MRVVMMDVDGVLVCGRPADGSHLFTDLEKDLGLPLEMLQREFFEPRWADIVTGKRALKEQLADALLRFAPDIKADTLIQYWFENDSRISTDILEVISQVRSNGARVFLATNQEHMRAAYLMNDMGLSSHVDGIVYSAALGYRKPEDGFYKKAQDAAGASAHEIILIDDTEKNVLAARAFGWDAFHWTKDSVPDDILARV